MQGKPLHFYPFKLPKPLETQFFHVDDSENIRFMEEDLAKSGLTYQDIHAYTAPLLRKEGALASYAIPYFHVDGNPITDSSGQPAMFRIRMKFPEFSREQRYTQPSGDQLIKLGLPPFVPYIHPLTLTLPGEELICAEGEKKCASILKILELPAFAIGGCQLWRNPDGSGSLHPWIRDLISRRRATSITIVPDGDVKRYDICSAYGNFARTLENEGIHVKILYPRGKIDDLLVQWGASAAENWSGIESLNIKDLVQPASSLIKKYGLAFKTNAKGEPTVHQHTSNVMRLMEEHDAFPKFWRNLDTNKVMVGDSSATPDLTEMEIANYLQYNLQLDKVTHRLVFSCIQALSKKNARSPFLDWVRAQVWDGTPRLGRWFSDFWGVSDSDYSREVATKFLVSACARMDKPGTKIDWMLIVIGPQGVGKTSMPSILFNGNNLTLYGEQNDKDLHMLLHSALCVGFDELDSFGKRESSNLKAMVTRNEDAFRPPYGASVEVFPRRFTLYGCGNRHDFLQHDPSGYRRYAIVEVARLLDFGRLEEIRSQLWAEAWHIYTTGGCKYWEVDGASEQAKNFVIPSQDEEQIDVFLQRKLTDKITPGKDPSVIYFTMKELLQFMGFEKLGANSFQIREIAAILQAKGVEKPLKPSRHPDTGALGKWYEYRPRTPI